MKLKEMLDILHESLELSSATEIKSALEIIMQAQDLSSAERDVLEAAFLEGPLYDGDLPSKVGRDALLHGGLLCKVVVKGEDGKNAVTQRGYWVYKLVKAGA